MPKFMYLIIVVVIIIIVSVIRIAVRSSNRHFECPECSEKFQVGFSKSFFTAHGIDGKSFVKCPKCGKANMLSPIAGKK